MELQSANLQQHNVSGRLHKGWSFNNALVKNLIGYTTGILLLLAAASFLLHGIPQLAATHEANYLLALTCFFAGIAHIFTFPKWLPQLYGIRSFIYTAVVAIAIGIIAALDPFNTGFSGGLLQLPAACAFALPPAISLCWFYFSGIPAILYKEWYIPDGMQPEKRMSLLLNSILFHIQVKVTATDSDPVLFNVTLNDKLTIGAMFCRFLYDQDGRIAVVDADDKKYAWRFYKTSFTGKRSLDPELSLNANGIKEGDHILIERIKK